MKRHKVTISDLIPLDVWVTPNIKIFRQVDFWKPLYKTYQFVPAQPMGYVILTRADEKMHCRPLQGYRLYRPASITLSWLSDKVLNFRELSMVEGITWCTMNRGRWKVIGEYTSKTDSWGAVPF